MKRIWQDNKIMLTFFGFVACVVACFVLTNAMVPVAHADGSQTKGNTDNSFAKISEAATIYVNTMSDPYHEGCNEIEGINVGNAGGLVGFLDTDSNDRGYWGASRDTSNVLVWSYSALGNIKTQDAMQEYHHSSDSVTTTVVTIDAPQGYAAYGFALSQAGLDEVHVGNNSSGLRMMIGILFIVLYVLAIGMSSFFNLCISILEIANPFKMFSTASGASTAAARGSGGGWIPQFQSNGYGWGDSIVTALQEIQTQVGKLYDILFDMSLMLLIPLAIAIAFFLWLVVNKGQNFKGIFKNLFVRIIFLCIGVPALFAIYGVVLDSIKGSITASGSPATSVVGSMFCDFQYWVNTESNIGLPNGNTLTVDLDSMTLDSESVVAVRGICYDINKMTHPGTFTRDPGDRSGGLQGYANYDDKLMTSTEVPRYKVGEISNSSAIDDISNIGAILSMLTRYANGSTISAANYESNVGKGLFGKNEKGAIILFGVSQTWQDYDDKCNSTFEYKGNDGVQAGDDAYNHNVSAFEITEDQLREIAKTRWTGCSDGDMEEVNIFDDGTLDGSRSGNTWTFNACGSQALSTLAMYNYLNTQFTPEGVRVASPNATSNDQVKYEHYAVSTVGSGLMKVVYLLDAFCLLACASIIGYGYGLAMMLGNFKALFKMIPPVLTGMLGSMRGIASAVVLTFAMICEVVFTVVMFDVSMSIIYSVYKLVELPLAKLLDGALGSINGAGGTIVTALLGFTSVAIILTLCKKLLQWRSAVVSATTQACTDMVNKIMGTSVSRPDLDTDGNKLLAAGATVASLGVAAARGGLISGESMSSLTDKTKDSLTAAFGDEAKTQAAVDGALGVEHGSLGEVDATVSGDSSGDSLSNSNMMDNVSESERSVISSRNDYAAERGINDDYTSEVLTNANSAEFESELGIGDEAAGDDGNPLVGDDTTEAKAYDYVHKHDATVEEVVNEDGTVTKTTSYGDVSESITTDSDGNVVGMSRSVTGADGSTDLTSYSGTNLAETDDAGAFTNMTGSRTVHTDANGIQTIHEEVIAEGGRTIVDQTVSHDDAGNVTTVSQSSGPGGVHTAETMVSNASTGESHIDRQVSTPAGTTYIHEDQRVDGQGRVVVDSNVVNNDGSRVNTSAINTKSGDLISSTERVYNTSGQEVSNTITQVTRQNAVTTVNTTTESAGQKIHVVDNYDMSKGRGTSITTTTQGNVQNVTRQQYKYNESNERIILNEVNKNNIYTMKGSQTDYSAWAGSKPSGSNAPKYNQGVGGGTPYGGTGRNASTGDFRGGRPGGYEVPR